MKRCLLTGAYGTLGQHILALLLKESISVVGIVRTQEDKRKLLENLSQSDQKQVCILVADLSSYEETRQTWFKAKEWFNAPLDALIHTVGGFAYTSISDSSEQDYEMLFGSNFKSAWTIGSLVLKDMIQNDHGRMAFVSSHVTLEPGASFGLGLYGASKAALNYLITSMQKEAKGSHVSINGVLPSVIDNPENQKAMGHEDRYKWVKPDDLARFMLSLVFHQETAPIKGALIAYPSLL